MATNLLKTLYCNAGLPADFPTESAEDASRNHSKTPKLPWPNLTVEDVDQVLSDIAHGRPVLPTHEAAPILNREPQTLRRWACLECGPIRPIRINGRLAWRVSDLREILVGGAK